MIQEISKALLKKKDRSLICGRLNMRKTACKPNSHKTSPFLNADHFSLFTYQTYFILEEQYISQK